MEALPVALRGAAPGGARYTIDPCIVEHFWQPRSGAERILSRLRSRQRTRKPELLWT